MLFHQKRAVLALTAAALIALTIPALARPAQQRHSARLATVPAAETAGGADRDDRYPNAAAARPTPASRRAAVRASRRAAPSPVGEFAGSDLVAEARRYLGTNPTGRGSLWCAAFMDLVLKRTGHAGGGNLASAYARYGTRVSGPQVGAIAVMGRRGGGHVGVVSGVDANGNPIVVSGNHNRTVAESVYPRSRIVAYVMPGS